MSFLAGEEKVGCFTLIVFLLWCGCVLCLFLAVLWVGLWSVNVAFPGHTNIINMVEPTFPMLQTKAQGHWPFGLRDVESTWEWHPSWSCDQEHYKKFRFPHHKES